MSHSPEETRALPSIDQLLDFLAELAIKGPEVDFADCDSVQRIHVSRLFPDPKNARRTIEAVLETAESIRKHGLLNPVRVRPGEEPGTAIVKRGNRRLLAMLLLLWQARENGNDTFEPLLDCRPLSDEGDEFKHRIKDMVDNLEREEIPPREEAMAYQEMLDETPDLTIAQLADNFGGRVTEAHISARLCLLNLATAAEDGVEVLQHFLDGRITLTDAQQIGRLPRSQQEGVAIQAVRRQLNGTDLKGEVSRLLGMARAHGNGELRDTTVSVLPLSRGASSGSESLETSFEPVVRTWEVNAGKPTQIAVKLEQTEAGRASIRIDSAVELSEAHLGELLSRIGAALQTPREASA